LLLRLRDCMEAHLWETTMTLQATLEKTPKDELEKIFPQSLDAIRTRMDDRPDHEPEDREVYRAVRLAGGR
jgi:hypothetical protein